MGAAREPGNVEPLSALMPRLRAGGVRAVAPNGILGDPRGASAEEGRALLAAATADLRAFVAEHVRGRQDAAAAARHDAAGAPRHDASGAARHDAAGAARHDAAARRGTTRRAAARAADAAGVRA